MVGENKASSRVDGTYIGSIKVAIDSGNLLRLYTNMLSLQRRQSQWTALLVCAG